MALARAGAAGVVRLVFVSTVWEVEIGLVCGGRLLPLHNWRAQEMAAVSAQTPLLVAAAILLLMTTSTLAAVILPAGRRRSIP